MMTITKKELVDRIADNVDDRRESVKMVVQRFLDEVIVELAKGNRLEFRDFGVFECKVRKARRARNPKTSAPVTVPERRTVKFKVGRLMKEQVENVNVNGADNHAEAAVINRKVQANLSGSRPAAVKPIHRQTNDADHHPHQKVAYASARKDERV